MRVSISAVSAVCLLGLLSVPAHAIDGKHVNGVGVYANWFFPFDVNNIFDCNRCPRGPIVKANIENNQVTSWDTLYDSLGQFPCINATGTAVAFFRWAQNVTIDKSTGRISPASTPTGKQSYISVVNLTGPKAVSNLIPVDLQLSCTYGSENNQLMDWPAGDWIYYQKPTQTCMIRRVNSKTLQDEAVCSWGSGSGCNIRRWNLSLDGKVAGSQSTFTGNSILPFPPNGKSISAVGCNLVVSSGGDILAHFYGGCHDDIDIWPFASWVNEYGWVAPNPWRITYMVTIGTIEGWLGKVISPPKCSDLNRWSVNSDKWVLRQIGWSGQGNDIALGCSQVMVNFIDKTAILGCPYIPQNRNAAPSPRNQWINAEAGDFYITGDASHPNSVTANSWEDTLGNWHQVIPTSIATDGTTREVLDYGKILGSAHGITIAFLRPIAFKATVFDCSGKIAMVRCGIGEVKLASGALKPGSYLVRVDSGNQVLVRKVTVAN